MFDPKQHRAKCNSTPTGDTALKHSPQTDEGLNHTGYRFGLLNQQLKKNRVIEAHSSNSQYRLTQCVIVEICFLFVVDCNVVCSNKLAGAEQ